MVRRLVQGVSWWFLLGLPVVLLVAFGVLSISARLSLLANGAVEGASGLADLSGEFRKGEDKAWFEGRELQASVVDEPDLRLATRVLGAVAVDKWIEVDLSEQKLIAHEGDGIFLESAVSSGKWAPTPTGEFRVWIKLRYAKMEGGVKGTGTYYYLPNVPFVMYFENDQVPGWRGYSLHGTYWHNNFGHPMSHGCVNLPTSVAEKLYYWAMPVLPEGKRSVQATPENPGIRIVIHE